ncbi:MAG: hypothetical protein EOP49_39320 [Sphingobacteriales bacterium]|nr:MAG: hypothetical protein EOP49_39320 [Sphingobacteriales bacterium]
MNFRWNITGGVSSNLTTDTLKVVWSAPGIKTIKVVAEADGCVSEPYEAQLQVVSSVAKPDIIPSGPLALCRGSAVKLSIDSSGSIQWFKNDSIIQGATAASYMVSQEGRYSVQQQLTGGCTMMSDTVTITVTGVPVETNITASGPTEGCVGDTLVLSTTTTGNITWFLNDTVITGANQSSLVVFKSGRYYVRSDNACASTASRTIDVKLSPVPPTPSIVANGVYELCQGDSAILTSSGQLLNEWYLNGEAIPAAVDSTLIVTRGGRYSVRVKGPGCPSALSPTVEISFRGLSNIVIESARTEICEDDSVTLSAQSSASIAWYRDGLLIADNSLPYLIYRIIDHRRSGLVAHCFPFRLYTSSARL